MSGASGFVERPRKHSNGPKTSIDYCAIQATAENGKAVRVALGSVPVAVMQNRLRQTLYKHGFRLRYEDTQDGHITAWAERITPNGQTRAPASAERSEDASGA